MSDDSIRPYEVFIEGESVDLCLVHEMAIEKDGWASWFNNTEALQATGHGIFPNYAKDQYERLESLKSSDQISLLVCKKQNRKAVGIVSLQKIDMSLRQAEAAIMIGNPKELGLPGISSLEAMALLCEHGFLELGLNRIYAGQVYPYLKGWNKLMEILGFKVDGISRQAFRRGQELSDVAEISLLFSDYQELVSKRDTYWPGLKKVMALVKAQPKVSFAEKLEQAIQDLAKDHYSYLE